MAENQRGSTALQCLNCGFEGPRSEWDRIEYRPLGTLTQCRECGSTNVTQARR
ncbi:MAG: hypothetical protein ABEJ74_04580 [Haloferacaceae archaeon]